MSSLAGALSKSILAMTSNCEEGVDARNAAKMVVYVFHLIAVQEEESANKATQHLSKVD